jgi:hypothetical protein
MKRGFMKTLVLLSFLIIGAFVLAGVGTTGSFSYEAASMYGALYDSQANFLYSRVTTWLLPNGDVLFVPPDANSVVAIDMSGNILGVGEIKNSLYDIQISTYRQTFMFFVGKYNPEQSVSSQVTSGNLIFCTTYDGRLIHLRNGRMYLDVFCDNLLNAASADYRLF